MKPHPEGKKCHEFNSCGFVKEEEEEEEEGEMQPCRGSAHSLETSAELLCSEKKGLVVVVVEVRGGGG